MYVSVCECVCVCLYVCVCANKSVCVCVKRGGQTFRKREGACHFVYGSFTHFQIYT